MRRLSKLSSILFSGILISSPVHANLYRVELNYGPDTQGEGGSLSGFVTFDFSLDTNNDRFNSTPYATIPNWITSISLTYDPTPGNPGDELTTTSFDAYAWELTNANTFDISKDFMNDGTGSPQFTKFGFFKNFNPMFTVDDNSTDQQRASAEFPLSSPTVTTPGGLPLLGLAALAYYYKKMKSKNYKL